MILVRRRLHLAGSAAKATPRPVLAAAHDLVETLARTAVDEGAGLVVGVGGEPQSDSGLPCTFDWTALEALTGASERGDEWQERPRFVVVASQRALDKIPVERLEIWNSCLSRRDFAVRLSPPGWRMAGLIRERQVELGDVLIVLGGGAGVEHLAQLYIADGKPVLPIASPIRALSNDGQGGATFLHQQALGDSRPFLELSEGTGDAAARLLGLRLLADEDATIPAAETISLIRDVSPALCFLVRLLDQSAKDFDSVEKFFREVVDPVVVAEGYRTHEVGTDEPRSAWINVEIFRELHHASVVVVDLTGVRSNCMLELGYALGRQRRVVISAKEGTLLPFDADKLPTHFWNESDSLENRRTAYRNWFRRYLEMPRIVPS